MATVVGAATHIAAQHPTPNTAAAFRAQDGTFDLSAAPPFTLVRKPCQLRGHGVLRANGRGSDARSRRRPPRKLNSLLPVLAQADLRAAIPAKCWEKDVFRSFAYLALDVGIVAGLAIAAFTIDQW